MADHDAARYAAAPVNARLAVALTGVERLTTELPVAVPGLAALVEHLWRWQAVDESTFAEWEAFDNPLRSFALGDSAPKLERQLREASPHLARMVLALVEIVEGNLYAAVDEARTQRHFHDVLDALDSHGVVAPPPESIIDWPHERITEWGDVLTDEELTRWREQLARA